MTILLTGGTGLVGTRLLPRLVETGVGCRVLVRPGKVAPLGATTVVGDILDPASLLAAVEGVEAIVHLAAVLRTPDPDQIKLVNLVGTRNVIAAAKKYAPRARFIMASTGLVYRADSRRPALEGDDVASEMPYPASKIAAEKELQESGLNWSVLRFGFVYGDDDGHLQQVPDIARLLKWHPANRLSMIHHRDIATLVRMGLQGTFDRRIVNAVDDAPMSICEICEMVGAPMKPTSTPLVNPWWGVLDGSFAQSLGFTPEVATTRQAARQGTL